jgi:hypothetical protein
LISYYHVDRPSSTSTSWVDASAPLICHRHWHDAITLTKASGADLRYSGTIPDAKEGEDAPGTGTPTTGDGPHLRRIIGTLHERNHRTHELQEIASSSTGRSRSSTSRGARGCCSNHGHWTLGASWYNIVLDLVVSGEAWSGGLRIRTHLRTKSEQAQSRGWNCSRDPGLSSVTAALAALSTRPGHRQCPTLPFKSGYRTSRLDAIVSKPPARAS